MMLPLVLLAVSGCTEEDEYTQGQWIKRSGFEAEPRAYACSFTIGDMGYLCGGFRGANKEYMNDLWVYDMNDNNWEQLADMPTVGRKYATAFALNGKGYVTTGSVKDGSYSSYVADTWEYDPSSDTWTQKDDFAGGPRDGALSFVVGGYAYVGTGYNEDTQGSYKDFYRFDPNAAAGSQWTKDAGNGGGPEKRAYGTAFVINNVAYVCCGTDNSSNLIDFWKFDGSTWTQLRDIHVINVSGTAKSVGVISGDPAAPIPEGTFKFSGCSIKADKGLTISNVEQRNFDGLEVRLPEGEEFLNIRDNGSTAAGR